MAVIAEVLEEEVPIINDLARHRFTCDDFRRIADLGMLGDDYVELIEGDIVQMPPPNSEHCTSATLLYDILRSAYGGGYFVMHERAIDLSEITELVPDVAVARGKIRDYTKRHPHAAEVCFVVEVSYSSLRTDRSIKAALYASIGISEFWIVNIPDQQVEVYRSPSNGSYGQPVVYRIGQSITPLLTPAMEIAVADFL